MKKPRSDYEAFASSSEENRRLLQQEELILEVTEALCEMIDREQITQTTLAERLGKGKSFVSQILAGGKNLTLRTVADVAAVLGYRLRVYPCREMEMVTRETLPFDPVLREGWATPTLEAPVSTVGEAA